MLPACPSSLDVTGRVLSGKYVVHRRIGQGGMGSVYEAENLSIGRRVALKVLDPALAGDPDNLTRFQREARAAARIGHPNILDVLDMGIDEQGSPYIVMELLDGFDLGRLIGAAPLGQEVAVDVLLQILAALGAAHASGIVHRDLKPENVFLARCPGHGHIVKVIDFGIARFQDRSDARITHQGAVLGTAAYMSPEQARGSESVDHRADLYAAGVILYESLSGQAPYRGTSYNAVISAIAIGDPPPLSKVAPWVDRDLASIVKRAMARHPEHRFQSAAELAEALLPFAAAEGRAVHPATRPRTTTLVRTVSLRPARRGRRLLAFLVLWAALWIGALLCWQRWLAAAPAPTARGGHTLALGVTGDTHARVLLDGRLLGTMPLIVQVPRTPGDHVLRVEADGFMPKERRIPLERPLHLVVNLSANGRSLNNR